MSKYIIEIKPEYEDKFKGVMILGAENSNLYVDSNTVDELEELNSDYINEHFGELQDTAYQRGFEDGKKEAESSDHIKNVEMDAFNKGMLFKEEKINDAFKRGFEKGKAQAERGCKGCEYEGKTGEHLPCDYCMNNFKNEWTAKDDKFEFGDEIIALNGEKGCVVSKDNEEGNTMYALFVGYRTPQCITQRNYRKTGKRYDIEKILEDMKHD